MKLSTLSDHPTKYSCQKLTSRYLSLSAWFSAGHEHCTLLNTTYKVGVPVITDQPVGWAVPAPLESARLQSQPESQAGELCTGGSHVQDPITSPVLGISGSSWKMAV